MKLREDGTGRLLLIPFAPGIGDMVMMEPLLRAVVNSMPDWRVTMVAKQYASDLLPVGDYELASSSYFMSETPAHLRTIHRLLPQKLIAWGAGPMMVLDLGPFERAINLFWAWESRTPFEEWWMPQWPLQKGVQHTVDVLADFLEEQLGDEIPGEARIPRLMPREVESRWAERYLRSERKNLPVASLVVSAANALKWWDAAKWAELNEELVADGWRTVLVAPVDHPHAREVYSACRTKPQWPSINLRQLVALLEQSSIVVGVDTGPLHIASALETPWVGLFGATNPDLIGPYDRSRGRALVARFPKAPSCAHCWLAFKNRGGGCLTLPTTGCTTMVPVSEVLATVDAVISGAAIASASRLARVCGPK